MPPGAHNASRHQPRHRFGRCGVHLVKERGVGVRRLLPDDGEEFEPLQTGRTLGFDGVTALAARVEALRRADDVLSAGELIGPAFRELEAAVNLFRESSHVDEVGRALLVQIGELAQIAGWIASDKGRHTQAETAYRLGTSAARQAGDAQLVTHVVGSLAYQMSNTGHPEDAADLVEAAITEAGPDIHPTASALAHDRLAWARTRAGERRRRCAHSDRLTRR